jgi:pantetheine-phosphate adenylyltransferase
MKTTALYAGSFDPLTNGHFDIIERASAIFDKIIIGVGTNSKKSCLFTPEERVELIKKVCKGFKNVSVESYSGLTVDFAAKRQCSVFVRGLRDSDDFNQELKMAYMNSELSEDIETVFFPTRVRHAAVSSTLVKEIVEFKGSVERFVPPQINSAIVKKVGNKKLKTK